MKISRVLLDGQDAPRAAFPMQWSLTGSDRCEWTIVLFLRFCLVEGSSFLILDEIARFCNWVICSAWNFRCSGGQGTRSKPTVLTSHLTFFSIFIMISSLEAVSMLDLVVSKFVISFHPLLLPPPVRWACDTYIVENSQCHSAWYLIVWSRCGFHREMINIMNIGANALSTRRLQRQRQRNLQEEKLSFFAHLMIPSLYTLHFTILWTLPMRLQDSFDEFLYRFPIRISIWSIVFRIHWKPAWCNATKDQKQIITEQKSEATPLGRAMSNASSRIGLALFEILFARKSWHSGSVQFTSAKSDHEFEMDPITRWNRLRETQSITECRLCGWREHPLRESKSK